MTKDDILDLTSILSTIAHETYATLLYYAKDETDYEALQAFKLHLLDLDSKLTQIKINLLELEK